MSVIKMVLIQSWHNEGRINWIAFSKIKDKENKQKL